jgi:hypothetical protein
MQMACIEGYAHRFPKYVARGKLMTSEFWLQIENVFGELLCVKELLSII